MSEQLVNTQESSVDTNESTAKASRLVNIVAKAAALTCALSWGFGSIWIFVRGLSAIRCIFAAVCMLFNSFLILCIEASIFLGFSEFAQPFIRLVSTIKMYQKALYYIISSTVIYIMCTDAWMANAFGYGMSIVAGVTYGYGVLQHRKQSGGLC